MCACAFQAVAILLTEFSTQTSILQLACQCKCMEVSTIIQSWSIWQGGRGPSAGASTAARSSIRTVQAAQPAPLPGARSGVAACCAARKVAVRQDGSCDAATLAVRYCQYVWCDHTVEGATTWPIPQLQQLKLWANLMRGQPDRLALCMH